MIQYREIYLDDVDWKEKLTKLVKWEEEFIFPIKCSGKYIKV